MCWSNLFDVSICTQVSVQMFQTLHKTSLECVWRRCATGKAINVWGAVLSLEYFKDDVSESGTVSIFRLGEESFPSWVC
jgi:hypothetical protein